VCRAVGRCRCQAGGPSVACMMAAVEPLAPSLQTIPSASCTSANSTVNSSHRPAPALSEILRTCSTTCCHSSARSPAPLVTHFSYYDRGAEYCDERVCLSVCVCLPAIISSVLHVQSNRHQILCACYLWPWLGRPLVAY